MHVKHVKDLISGLFLTGLGFYITFGSLRLSIWSRFGPDEGFFPLVTGIIIIGSSLLLVIRALHLTERDEKKDVPEIQEGVVRNVFKLCMYVLVIMLYGLLFEKGGFLIISGLFLLVMLKYVEKQSWKMTILIGSTSIIISYLLFVYFLGVLLPKGLLKQW